MLSLGVFRQKKTGLQVRLSMGETGPAIEAEPEAWAVIEHAAITAVAADPVARKHVAGPKLWRMARQPVKARG
ncbi:MAG: hypothetical protein EON48_15465 [Acetobacteraceae bacterium]|nr:MAG: hypothetical protein EON48_15465 [Acetobacteraceae bacterium]